MNTQLASEKLFAYKRNPALMVRELFKVTPDPWQDEVLEDFPHVPRQALAACKGPGKTAVLAWLAWNYLLTRPHPKIGALSITGKNLEDNLWAEMAFWQKKSPVLTQQFEWTSKSIHLRAHPETWFMSAKSWKPTTNSDELGQTLAGLWAKHVLFLLDEAGGIPVPIMRTAEAALQGEGTEGHLVIAGNTTSTDGCLYEAVVTRRHLWRPYEITADPDDPKRTPRISAAYARQQITEYGRDNPWVMINILAKFPTQGVNQVLSADVVRDCLGRHLHPNMYQPFARILGADVADQGDDRTVWAPRQGPLYLPPTIMRKMDSVQIASKGALIANHWQAESLQIDTTGGYGSGPMAILRDQGFSVMPVQFSESALNPKYYNKRAEIIWECAEHVKTGHVSLPKEYLDMAGNPHELGELVAEFAAATYSYKNDQIIIEPKASIKARLGRSPDIFEAYCCTHAWPVAAPDRSGLGRIDSNRHVSKTRTEYDPLERA
jgi:phage terminase large subunit